MLKKQGSDGTSFRLLPCFLVKENYSSVAARF